MAFKFNPFTGNFDDVADVANKIDKVASTDEAIVRYNGTDGDVQNSSVTIDDSGSVIIPGDLTVNGTTTTINTTDLDVTDNNITINKDGNDASSEGAGLRIERTGVDGSIIFEDALASKFKIGLRNLEVEVVDISSTQTITNKTIDADLNTITNIENADIKAAAGITISKLQALTVSRAVTTDGSGFLSVSGTTKTEIDRLSGVTSNVQSQLDSKTVITDIYSIISDSGAFTATVNKTHLVVTSGGAATITLPAVSANIFVRIKDTGNAEANSITISPASGTIDGAASVVIDSNYGAVVLASDGINWFTL